MHSAEPFDHPSTLTTGALGAPPSVIHPIPPNATPASESEEWRSEVASRVSSYRERHRKKVAEQQSLGFPPQNNDVAVVPASRAMPSEAAVLHGEGTEIARERVFCRQPHESVSGAFDTNYYRRLNALEQSAQAEAEAEVRIDPAAVEDHAKQELETALGPDCPTPTINAACDLAINLELHVPAAGDACLERYRIHGDVEPVPCNAAPSQPSPMDAVAAPVVSAAHGNLFAFPRPLLEPPLWAPPSRDELADPVSRPRILDVPEEIMPTVQGSLFPEIRLDADEPEPSARREPEIEVPLAVAPLKARLTAGLVDLAVVASAGALFAAIAGRAMPELGAKPFSIAIAVATVLLWAAYQQMFLLYAGRTLGMRIAGIRLSTFDGRTPRWSERRSRARYILISCASAALGFLWALVDQDTLCWHDRASRTFPTTN